MSYDYHFLTWLQPLFDLFGNYPMAKSGLVVLVVIAFANLITALLTRLVRLIMIRSGHQLDEAILRAMREPLLWSVVTSGMHTAVAMLELPNEWSGPAHSVINTLLILFWSTFFIRTLRFVLNGLSRRRGHNNLIRPQTLPLFNNLAMVVLLALVLYLMFKAWNIDMTAWLASAGVVGIAVGFAAKDTLANLFSGVFILADAPYKIGDYVVLDSGERGKITHIGLRSTRMLTRDDVEVTVPNSIMGNTRIVNQSGGPYEKFRIAVRVGVAYGSDIDQVREVLMAVALNELMVCADPEPRVRFRTFGASGLDFELLCWVEEPELRGRVIDRLNCAVYKRFMQEGIEIPYAKHDLYIKQLPPPSAWRGDEE